MSDAGIPIPGKHLRLAANVRQVLNPTEVFFGKLIPANVVIKTTVGCDHP
jgi:hypothetical protein